MMRNLFLIFLMPFILIACTSEGEYSKYNSFAQEEECDDGGTWVKVNYGDSYLEVKPKVKLKKGSAWEFRLKPRTSAYEKMLVTIKGKSADSDDDWINVQGTFEKNKTLVICVDPDQEERVKTYEYLVEIQEIGTLDPRAEVER